MPGIYDEPELYEAACAYRDVPAEVDALLRWAAKHSPGKHFPGVHSPANDSPAKHSPTKHSPGKDSPAKRSPGNDSPGEQAGQPRSVLELAAGPAAHARDLAGRGLAATALDLSAAMCARARHLAETAGVPLAVIEGDMRDFSLPGRFDLAITMLNSLCHLLTLDDMVPHLACVARHLAPGGLYIAELAHPADFFTAERRTSSEWSTEVGDGTVSVRWGAKDRIDPVTQITREHVSVTYHSRGGPVRTAADVVPNRFWTATEMTAAVKLAGGLAVAASYGDFDADLPVDAPEAWRMILVLRREDGPTP